MLDTVIQSWIWLLVTLFTKCVTNEVKWNTKKVKNHYKFTDVKRFVNISWRIIQLAVALIFFSRFSCLVEIEPMFDFTSAQEAENRVWRDVKSFLWVFNARKNLQTIIINQKLFHYPSERRNHLHLPCLSSWNFPRSLL